MRRRRKQKSMISRKKRKFTLLCLSTAAIIGCVGAVKPNTSFNQPVKAYAASTGNWYIQNIYAKEETTHGVYFSASQNPSGYSSSEYFSTGIKVYSKDNTGATYGSSSLKVSSNQFYIDFSEASAPKYGSSSDEKTRFDVKWRFSVSKNGVTSFCTSQEKVDTSGTPFSHIPYLFCTMAGSFGFQYRSLYWAGVR